VGVPHYLVFLLESGYVVKFAAWLEKRYWVALVSIDKVIDGLGKTVKWSKIIL
jgi:hypothetical protein